MPDVIYSVPQIAKNLEPIFSRYPVKKALLFGSYAKGEATEKSDVDICVDSDLRGFDFMVLVDDVHVALNKSVDIFPLRSVRPNSKVYGEINATGVTIYEK
jgi:predicted nucleotidyltransferase